jgi:cytochrome c553
VRKGEFKEIMMKLHCVRASMLVGGVLLAAAGNAGTVSGDAAAGAQKAVFCAYCHGVDGNPADAKTPRLAGQSAKVLVAKMKREKPYENFNHPMLQAFVTGGCLKDQDIRNLAAYYAGQPVRQSGTPAGGPPQNAK